MQRKPGSGGRQKRISGSGSVFRRGSGLGTGPVGSGGGFGGSIGLLGRRLLLTLGLAGAQFLFKPLHRLQQRVLFV